MPNASKPGVEGSFKYWKEPETPVQIAIPRTDVLEVTETEQVPPPIGKLLQTRIHRESC